MLEEFGTRSGELPPQMAVFAHLGETDAESGLLLPFAFEETLCRDVGESLIQPSVHLWSHPAGLVLGLRDSRLPYAGRAMERLEQRGIRTAVRHSGGAAVPLDSGVVNVSLLLPRPRGSLDFHDDFRLLAALITEAVACSHPGAAAEVRAGEVRGSYCPGDYDLAIGGRKFCGIAQRRQAKAYFVHAFVVVEGQGTARGELARSFYEEAVGDAQGCDYPVVRPETMGALGEMGGPGEAAVFTDGILQALRNRGVTLRSAGQVEAETGYTLDYADKRVQEAERQLRARYARG